MHQYRQMIHRMRLGQSDRAVARSRLIGIPKSAGVCAVISRSIDGPHSFIVGPKLWSRMSAHVQGYPVKMQAESVLGGAVLLSPYLSWDFENEAYMVTRRGGDLHLILGQDLAIGYESHNQTKTKLYFTESCTFRVLEPAAVINYTAANESLFRVVDAGATRLVAPFASW